MSDEQSKTPISIVVIGINVAETIGACLQSIQDCGYPHELLEVIYVDGGSGDESVGIARQFSQVKVIELVQEKPTPGRGRNAGWRAAEHSFIQFLDGDTILEKDWFVRSQKFFEDDVAAVSGQRRETEPRKNWYHLITDIEWNIPPGDSKVFGGDVLMRRDVLEETGGYNEELTAGEDPELSFRIRKAGWRIRSLPILMCRHDIRMETFTAYVKRSVRTGWAYAALAWRFRNEKEKFRIRPCARVVLSVIVPWSLFEGGIFFGYPISGAVVGMALVFRSLRKIPTFQKRFGLTFSEAAKYALHLSFVVYPQLIGVLKFIFQKAWRNAA